MSVYLLDTNILSELVYDPLGPTAQRLRQVSINSASTSVIVACELRYGLAKRSSPRLAARVEALLSTIKIHAFEHPADQIYGSLRATLERQGTPIGHVDTFIAAHALALDYTLVTENTREFERVEGLRVENWIA